MTGDIPKQRRSFVANTDGATAVEFAIVSGAFICVVMGIAYVGIMLFTNLSINWAVKYAARQAMLNHAITQASIASSVNNYLASVGLPDATVSYSIGTSNGVQTAIIAATSTQAYSLPFVSTIHVTFSSTASVPFGF
jgi:Flp pilus assembly protein TadG